MPRSDVLFRSPVMPRVAVLALIAIGAAGCSDSARFDSSPYAARHPQPQETTGSIASRPVQSDRIESQPLPAPSRPATVVANGGVATGAQGLGAYRPGMHSTDVTGSVSAPPVQQPAPVGHWTWEGGSPVTVGQGETIEIIARKYGVPQSAILQTNNITDPASIRPGQRLVIPRYTSAAAPLPKLIAQPVPQSVASAEVAEDIHIIGPGETMLGIAKRHGVSITALAKANNIQPYAKIAIGDRLTIPGGHHIAQAAPQPTQPRTTPPVQQAIVTTPTQNARIATPEVAPTESITKVADPTGAMPSFRWPVHGRVISAFGSKTNGQQNDGINVAVPEGTPVKATDDGVVAYSGNELKGYGNLVLVRHANGYVSAYANASELLVKRGDTIKRGQIIARSGQTGNVTSPQLHFEIRKGSTPVDPAQYLNGG
jgi:murein DD-endopeptidase MepM/ murein hydrolase activator NlpD